VSDGIPEELIGLNSSVRAHRDGLLEERPQVGSICRIDDFSPGFLPRLSRLALVIAEDSEVTEILLIHDDQSLATATDCVFSSDESGLGYPVVVQTDLRGVVWTVYQVVEVVGRLGPEDCEEILQLSGLSATAIDSPRNGAVLNDEAEPRWSHKLSELDDLRVLTADCSKRSMIEHQRLDWALFADDVIKDRPDKEAHFRLLNFLLETDGDRVLFEQTDVEQLLNNLPDPKSFGDELEGLGKDFLNYLLPKMQSALESNSVGLPSAEAIGVTPERIPNAGTLDPGGEEILITADFLWTDPSSMNERFEEVYLCDV